MNKKKPPFFLLPAFIVLLVVTLSVVVGRILQSADMPSVVLPPPMPSGGTFGLGGDGIEFLDEAIEPETLSALLQNINRAPQYFHEFLADEFSDDGNSSTIYKIWYNGSDYKIIEEKPGSPAKHMLIKDNTSTVWYSDNIKARYKGTPPAAGIAELFQGIATYDQLITLSPEQIISAEFANYQGSAGMYIEYIQGGFGYIHKIYVSIDSGLILSAEIFDGEILIYSMSSLDYSNEAPDKAVFVTPA